MLIHSAILIDEFMTYNARHEAQGCAYHGLFQGQPLAVAHWSTPRWPPKAAIAHADSSPQGHQFFHHHPLLVFVVRFVVLDSRGRMHIFFFFLKMFICWPKV
jgi:hypothetical protein